MSTDIRGEFVDDRIPEAHLKLTRERTDDDFPVDPERGLFYCSECENRITRSTKTENEYGHERDCSHHQTLGGGSS